jgi:predicted metal-binding membrane protein
MIGAFRTPADSRWYRASLSAVVASAWIVLALWGASPFAGLLSHRSIGTGPLPAVVRSIIFVSGWTLMTIAMMLPSSLPLINLFRTIVAERPDAESLVLRLIIGYLGVWAFFGLLAYRGDAFVHRVLEALPEFGTAASWIGATILLAAGVYQFTPLKQICLEKCRSPYSFLVEHWRGRRARWDALRLGIRHGLFCVGCCWTLMLLMFAVGGANLGWMLALGGVMAAERTTRWGRYLTRPLGVTLTALAVLLLAGIVAFPGS